MAEDIEPIINETDPPTDNERANAFKTLYLTYVETNLAEASTAYQNNYWLGMANKYLPSSWDGKDTKVLEESVTSAVNDLKARGATVDVWATAPKTAGGYQLNVLHPSLSNLVPVYNNLDTRVSIDVHGTMTLVLPRQYEKDTETWSFSIVENNNTGTSYIYGTSSDGLVWKSPPKYLGMKLAQYNQDVNYVIAVADFVSIDSNNGGYTTFEREHPIKASSFSSLGMYQYDLFRVQEKLKKGKDPSPSPGPSSSSRLFIEATSGVSGRHGSPIPTVLEYTIPTARTDATVYGSGGDGGHGGGGGAGASCPLICEFETDKAESVNQTVYAQHHGYGGKGGAAGKGGNGCVIVFY